MTETALDHLLAAVDDGDDVALDGLVVASEADGFRFETPSVTRTGLDEGALRGVAADNEAYVDNWYYWTALAPSEPARRAFLRWLEGADERSPPERVAASDDDLTRSWGQLRVSVALDGPVRRYGVRHTDDADASLDDLARHEDPLTAREIAKHDAKGRYRPLKTAPSLVTGWAFADLEPGELCRVVDFLYPATIANWHREREGDLDVSHFRETAERQTGIYSVIEDLDGEAVEWLAEACCVDSQCLKRREWDEDAETPLDAPRGDGEFPCREPCSLVVAAARTWTKLEDEPTRTYEFELTPSEKAQVESLVDAVADGRIDEIREADVGDGANRYRARFLRAKLFDEDGNLCGVPTGDEDGGAGGH